jgi:hypothetical protein
MVFRVNNLPRHLKAIHKSQIKWTRDNWRISCDSHSTEIESLLKKIHSYRIWKSHMQSVEIAKKILPEMVMDGLTSVHFSNFGLYRYANSCLRSLLENGMRLVYFVNHEVEFKWWLDDNEWYKDQKQKYVWGSNFDYFRHLENITIFNDNCTNSKRIFTGSQANGFLIKKLYKRLSSAIHASADAFHTSNSVPSPAYDVDKFNDWKQNFIEVNQIISIVLSLGIPHYFTHIRPRERDEIFSSCIMDTDYINEIKRILSI